MRRLVCAFVVHKPMFGQVFSRRGQYDSVSFACFSTLLESTGQDEVKDQKLERLLLWISNCVQMLLFLKHTFQLPELSSPEIVSMRRCSINSPRNEHTAKMPSPRKEDSAKHAHAQLVTGLEEIVMFCFQQSVYTITKVMHLDPYFLRKRRT